MEKTINISDKELNELINRTIDDIVFGGKEIMSSANNDRFTSIPIWFLFIFLV